MSEVTVTRLRAHQQPVADSVARFKVVRAGRRWGKDVLAEHCSLLGHGPRVGQEPVYRGLIHGLDVVWLAPTIPQAQAMWKNEVEPRFRFKDSIAVNQVEKTVTLLNPNGTAFSTLWVRSAEAITSIRGVGAKLGGVVINEAAWMDLETAWRDVLRPTLMDCGGWALIMSTTNGGPDGYQDEHGPRSPSFFNQLCEAIAAGERGPEWAEFYGTAADNPKIDPEEFRALVAEYPQDSVTLAQEVYAKLVVGGAGLAFPEWRDDLHTTTLEPERSSAYHRWSAGMDWGHAKPGAFLLFATSGERSVCRWEHYFSGRTAYDVGFTIGQRLLPFPRTEWIALDEACFAVTDGGPTIAEDFAKGLRAAIGPESPPVIAAPKGAGSRVASKMKVHEALKFAAQPDGSVKAWDRPKLLFHTCCANTIRTLPKLPRDVKNPEDVDTDAEDHAYDALRYWLMARTPQVEREPSWNRTPNVHPGLRKDGSRRRVEPVPVVAGRFQRFNGQAGAWDE